jgi:YggT family protein
MRDTLIALIEVVGNLISLLIIARSILSFFPVDRNQLLVKMVYDLTEPLLAPIRNLLPQTGMLDFSPMVAILLIILLEPLLTSVVRALF